jgi:TonB-linked SusC/RagA family outer membrane protein
LTGQNFDDIKKNRVTACRRNPGNSLGLFSLKCSNDSILKPKQTKSMKLIACCNFFRIQRKLVAKTLLIMKITAVLFLAFCLSVNAKGYSQKISLSLKNAKLERVFSEISTQSDYTFVYTESLLKKAKRITATQNDASIDKVLEEVLKGQGLTFSLLNSIVIIKELELPVQNENLLPPPPIKVKGIVVDELGKPLQGVTILIKGTNLGSSSDANGAFEIEFSEKSSKVLVFSFVGMENKEMNVAGKDNVKISLKIQNTTGSEIVMVGYGSQKKATVTGSISTVKGDVLVKNPSANFASSLAGRLPGLIVNARSGDPGNEGVQILIRGKSTLGSTSVLTVIDGVPGLDIQRLNPADIESVSILKDASAAIYGAQAANGVILVTTKRGKIGKPLITYSGNYANTQPTRLQNLMNSTQYAIAENEYLVNNGLTKKWSDQDITLFKDGTDPMLHPNINWYDATFRKWTPQMQHNISLSGGTEALKYFISGQILDQDRIFKENDGLGLNRYQLRANIDARITKSLTVGLDINYNKNLIENAYDGNSRPMYSIRQMFPNMVPFWPNGLPGNVIFGQNPVLMGSTSKYGYNRENSFGLNTKISFKLDLSQLTNGLFLEGYGNFGDGSQNFEKFFKKSYFYNYNPATNDYVKLAAGQTTQNPDLRETNNRTQSKIYNIKLGYQRTIGNHAIDAFASIEQSTSKYAGFWAYRKDYLTDQLPVLSAGNDVGKDNNGYSSEGARLNYFGRVNYAFKEKYLLSATLRYDGSQNFPENNRFGLFPGVSAGWLLSKESFIKDNFNFVTLLKIKGSWGKMGNDAVPPFQYLATYQYGGGYYFGIPSTQKVPGFALATTPNPNITWEIAETKNLGFETVLWKGLLGFNFDIFQSNRSNILTKKNASTPDYTGLVLPDVNIGTVQNNGFEMELSHSRVINSDFSYGINANMSYARSKITFFDESPNVPLAQQKTGYPIDSWLLFQADGLYQTQAEIDATPHLPNTAPGDIKYIDVNKDGKIGAQDMVRNTKSPTPEIMFGVNLSAKYKNWEFSVLLQGQAKSQVKLMPEGLYMDKAFFDGRWQKQGDNLYPRSFNSNRGSVGNNALASTFWMKDCSFIRLKNIEIGYSLPKNITNLAKLSNVRLFVSAANLFMIMDNVKLVDPETLGSLVFLNSANLASYPIQKMVNVGVNVSF